MGMEQLNLGADGESDGAGATGPAPTLTEAHALMTERAEVHGVGVGATEAGERCVVLFADRLPPEVLPDRLDGLPVRVHESDSFVAETEAGD
ncbi:MAG: hypothetical protein WA912_10655 [Ornithinimicrobium sp.]